MNPIDIKLIEKFFSDNLTEAEQKEFETKMKDKVFASEVSMYSHMIMHLQQTRKEEVQASLEVKKAVDKKAARLKTNKIARIIISTIVLAIGAYLIFSFFISPSVKSDIKPIAETYLTPYDYKSVNRGGDPDAIEILTFAPNLETAEKTYDEEKYEEFLTMTKTYTEPNNKKYTELYINILLCRITAFLILDQTDEARELLMEVRNSNMKNQKEHGDWHLAISYLKDENIDAFNEALVPILSDVNHKFNVRAQRLKSELDKMQ